MTYLPLRLLRWFLWEIAQRIEINRDPLERLGVLIHRLRINDLKLFAVLPDGNKIKIKVADFPSFGGLIDVYDYETYERKYRIKRGDTVIDVGANIGFFTLKAAKSVGSEGLVIAIEPDPFNFKALLGNLRINALEGKVIAINGALGDADRTIKFYIDRYCPSGSSSYTMRELSVPIEVKMSKLVSLIKRLNIKRVDFLKCDAEGAEVDIIDGALEALTYIKHMTIAVYHVPLDTRLILANTLKKYGFKVILTKDGILYVDRKL